MIQDLLTRTLRVRSDEIDEEIKVFFTLLIPEQNATATISLSTLTVGGRQGLGGLAACCVRKAFFMTGPRTRDFTPVATSYEQNSLRVNRCVSVTYQLTVTCAEAIAQCNLFLHDAPIRHIRTFENTQRHTVVFDRKSKGLRSVHHIEAVPGARLPADRFLLREVLRCAAGELKVPVQSLQTAFHPESIFHFQPGLRFDPGQGRLLLR